MLPFQLSFITGQSDPQGHALSPAQQDFLAALPGRPEWKLHRNFPWREQTPPWRDTHLVAASISNYLQYLAAQRRSFARRHREDLEAWAGRAEHHILFAGSCGLELLRRLDPPESLWPRLHVFAFGPVVRAAVPWRLYTVQGREDWISKLYVKQPDARVGANHMSYLEDPEVRRLAAVFVEDVLTRAQTRS